MRLRRLQIAEVGDDAEATLGVYAQPGAAGTQVAPGQKCSAARSLGEWGRSALVILIAVGCDDEAIPRVRIPGENENTHQAALAFVVDNLDFDLAGHADHARSFWVGDQCGDVGLVAWMLPGFQARGLLPALWSALLVSLTSSVGSLLIGPKGKIRDCPPQTLDGLMCILVLAWNAHPRYSPHRPQPTAMSITSALRPTRQVERAAEHFGRARLACRGTWLGIDASVPLRIVTNFAICNRRKRNASSRGALIPHI